MHLFTAVDLSSSALEEAKEQWEKNGKRFAAKFCELNPCMVPISLSTGCLRMQRLLKSAASCQRIVLLPIVGFVYALDIGAKK